MKRAAMAILSAATLLACARAGPPPPPLAPALEASNDLTIALTWTAAVDLDLYVTDPTWETVYFANTPNRAGARLERDERCRSDHTNEGRIEIVRLPPREGPYRVGVDFIDACGSAIDHVGFRVVATVANERREITGTATTNIFAPIVFELALQRGEDGAAVFASNDQAH